MSFVHHVKSCLAFVVLSCICLTISGQYFVFSNLHENNYLYNPARITNISGIQLQGAYRNPIPGNQDYVNYNGSFVLGIEDLKSSFGLYALRDIQGQGIITFSNYAFQYGFHTKLSRFWKVAAGLEVSYSHYNTRFANLDYGNPNPGISDISAGFIDFGAGLEFTYRENAAYGLSFSRTSTLFRGVTHYLQPGINAYYEGDIFLRNFPGQMKAQIEPLINLSFFQETSVLLYGSRLDLDNYLAGLYLRQNLRFNFDAIIILLGIRFGKASLFYSYDINLSGVGASFTNLAAHEVTFLYNMQYNRKSKKKGAIKCPKI